jgi:VWFA-related protein
MRTSISVFAAVCLLSAGAGLAQDAAQTPSFRSGVEALPIDVTVVNDRGEPVRDLLASDFSVRIDGRPRRLVSAQWVAAAGSDGVRPAPAPVSEGYVSNETSVGGRLIVLVIDQPNIPFGDMRPLRGAIDAFIDRLSVADRVAVVGLGTPSISTPFIANHEQLKQAVAKIPGQKQMTTGSIGSHEMGVTAAIAIERGDEAALNQVAGRDCIGSQRQIASCRSDIQVEASQIVQDTRRESETTLGNLREVLTSLKAIDAPKTLMFVSQGFYTDRERDDTGRISEIGGLASAARTSIYSLRMDDNYTDVSRSKAPMGAWAAEDTLARRYGLETLTFAARGALFNLTGTGAAVFERISSELAGYYLLGIEPDARDRDGKAHPVRVDVGRTGMTIRAHRTLLAGADTSAAGARTPREAVTAAISSPLPSSSLPIKAIAFAFRGGDSKVRLLIHAEVGSNYTAPQRLAIAYYVLDKDGKSVDGQVSDVRLAPAGGGLPSALIFSGGASVEPGEYVVKLAVADGDRIGSIDLPVRASLLDLGHVKLTELIAGGPLPPVNLLRPTVGARVSFGTLHGYLEAYGPDAATLGVKFEVAADDRGPAILSADVQGVLVGDERVVFSQMILVQSLPPGSYRLRAMIRQGNTLLTSLGRAFEIASPPVIATSRASSGPPTASAASVVSAPGAPLYLPVEPKDLARPFGREEALNAATRQAFQERVPPASQAAFDEGIAHLQKREYKDAETSFKRAIQPDADSTGSLAYLGVTYAAAGRDTQAANVWRTAMAGGDDIPQLYEWLGDALMRLKSSGEARPVLEEASERWPADVRFHRRLALIYATFGKGLDAVRLLEKSVQDRADDQASLFLLLEWMFNVHRGGQLVHDRIEDARLAHAYAERYLKAGGLNEPLVRQWLGYFDKEAP